MSISKNLKIGNSAFKKPETVNPGKSENSGKLETGQSQKVSGSRETPENRAIPKNRKTGKSGNWEIVKPEFPVKCGKPGNPRNREMPEKWKIAKMI